MVTRKVLQLGEDLKNEQRTIRQLVTFSDEELTDDKIDDRKRRCCARSRPSRRRAAWCRSRKKSLTSTEKGQAEVSACALEVLGGARRAVEADSGDRVHRAREAADDRGDQEQVESVQRTEREIGHAERQLAAKAASR